MKRLAIFGGALLLLSVFVSLINAEPTQVIETSIGRVGTPITVSISTSVWTKVPTSRTLSNRTEVIVDEPASNTANMVAHYNVCSSTFSSVATTVRPIEIIKGEQDRPYEIDGNTCLWVLSLHTAAENLHYQEVSRRNGP